MDYYALLLLCILAVSIKLLARIRQLTLNTPFSDARASVIVVLGPYLSGKSSVVSALHAKLTSAGRPYLLASSSEFEARLPAKLLPSPLKGRADAGDALFDMWTWVRKTGTYAGLQLTQRGLHVMSAIHESWITLLQRGVNLLVEYRVTEERATADCISQLRRAMRGNLARFVIVELRVTLSELVHRETQLASHPYPPGFVHASFKASRDLACFPSDLARVVIDVPTGMPPEDVTDRVFHGLTKLGLV